MYVYRYGNLDEQHFVNHSKVLEDNKNATQFKVSSAMYNMVLAIPDKFLENASYMPLLGEKD